MNPDMRASPLYVQTSGQLSPSTSFARVLGESRCLTQGLQPLSLVFNTPRTMAGFSFNSLQFTQPDDPSGPLRFEASIQSGDAYRTGIPDPHPSPISQSGTLQLYRPDSPNPYNFQIETPEEPVYPHSSPSASYTVHQWPDPQPDPVIPAAPEYYDYPSQTMSPFTPYPAIQTLSPSSPSSPNMVPPSPYASPANTAYSASPTPSVHPVTPQQNQCIPRYSYRDQTQFFKDALNLPTTVAGDFVPQQMYRPHTNSDRRRYVEEVDLDGPIYFWMENPSECGIPLTDALHSRVRRLQNRDETVFTTGRGPSISVRIQWPGYRQWSRQIPTKDFRSPPGPITRAKLAKNVAKCVQRFIDAKRNHPLEDDVHPKWKVGTQHNEIKLDDLLLVSMHHVSMGSWQPHLRLRRPFPHS
jgi:hypothetical protein